MSRTVIVRAMDGLFVIGNFGSQPITGYNHNISINFDIPTQAFGVDLYAFTGYGDTAVARIYATDRTTLLYTLVTLTLNTNGDATFLGFKDVSGIGKVTLDSSGDHGYFWSPLIDNLTFGVVPEPSTGLMLSGGLALLVASHFRSRKAQMLPTNCGNKS